MQAMHIANFTRRLGAPINWDHERDGLCFTLEILDFQGYMISLWEPTDHEKELIAKGHPIKLFIQGKVHPVVALEVQEEIDGTQT